MAQCKQLSHPGQNESKLYSTILSGVANGNVEVADEVYAQFFTPEFIADFGDWIGDYEIRKRNSAAGKEVDFPKVSYKRVDTQGEPKIWKDAETGKYYYVDKYDKRRFFYKGEGLDNIYSYSEILNVSRILAFNYIKSSTGMNFADLNISDLGESLSNSIKNKINATIERLNATGDPDKMLEAESLKETLDKGMLHDWEGHVQDYFRGLKLIYKEDQEVAEIEETEGEPRSQQFSKASFERSSKENISTNVKLRLSLLQDPTRKDPIFDESVFVPFDEVYSVLLNKLSNRVPVNKDGGYQDMFEIYLGQVKNMVARKPFLAPLYDNLLKADENLKYEFVQAFNLDKYNFMTTEMEKDKLDPDARSYKVMNVSGVGSKAKTIQSNWHNTFQEYFVNKFGKFLYDKRDPSDIVDRKKELKEMSTLIKRGEKVFSRKNSEGAYKTESDLKGAKNFLLDNLYVLGVELTPQALDLYLDDLQMERSTVADRANTLNKTLESVSFLLDDLLNGDIRLTSNPFGTQNIFNAMAEAEAFYTNEGSDANIFSAGKSKWVYSKPSYLSYTVKQWKKNPELLKAKLDTIQGESSKFIKFLLAYDKVPSERETYSQERLNNLEITTFNTFQERRKGKEAKDGSDLAINDFHADTINKLLRPDGPIYSSPTPADKGTHYQVQIGFGIITNAVILPDGAVSIDGNAVEVFYDYFKSEYKRMKKVKEEIDTLPTEELITHYHLGAKNGLKSQIFPSLSFGKFDGIASGFELYNADGTNALEDLDTIKDQLMDVIEAKIVKGIESTKERLYEKGLIIEKDGVTKYPGIDKSIVESYKELRETNVDLRLASDAYVNGLMSQVEYSKMFSGDVAFYKNSVDYKKRIPATYTDGLQLRLRSYNEVKDDAERDLLRKGEYNFNISVIASIYRGSPAIKEIQDTLKPEVSKYYTEGINSADAQAWITPQRWKFLMERLGKWDSTYEATYNKIMSGEKFSLSDKDLKKVLQPLKGVYFDMNSGVPVYLKYSQAVLIPQLIEGSPLQGLYDKMTKDEDGVELPFHKQVHELITEDGVKVGAPNPTVTHDENGNLLDDVKLHSTPISNSGWKLQQDLPTKGVKGTPVGSQIQKNIYGGLAKNLSVDFVVGNTEMKGQELIDHINDIVAGLSDRGKGALIDEFKIREGGAFGNIRAVYQSMIDELKERGSGQNVIDALEAEVSPYGIPQAQKTLMNVFSSMFLKKLVKIKTNGGSFIQMSNYGLNKTDADKQGVIWSPRVKVGDTAKEPVYLKNAKGEYILSKSGKKIVSPGEILIGGSFIAKYIPNYKDYSPEQLFGEYNDETGRYEGGVIDNDILQNIIGYRIPNQGLASNDSLQIVGILPETMGDTVVAYTGITTKTGSDFDIDKMYMMMPSYLPQRGVKSKLKDHVTKLLTKQTKPETKAAINEIVKELGLSTDVNAFADLLMGTKDQKKLNNAINRFTIEVIDNADKGTSSAVKSIEALGRTDKVEKLNYVSPEVDEDGKYLPASEQGKEQLENMLIEAYKAVLTNPATINDVMTPIDFPYMKDDINHLHEKEATEDLSDFDIFKDIDLKYEFLAGKAGVGQEANALVDHVRGLMADMHLKDVYLGRGHKINDKSTVFDREYSETLSKTDMKEYFNDYNKGKDEKDKLKWDEFVKLSKTKISNSLSAVLNAFVDIAKDPYITRGNWTTQTTNTGNMLLRAGFHPFYVNALIGQPIISEYIDFVTNKESKLVDDTGNMQNKFKVELVKRTLSPEQVIEYENMISYTKDGTSVINNSSLTELTFYEDDMVMDQEPKFAAIVYAHKRVFLAEGKSVTKMSLAGLREQIKGEENFGTQVEVIQQFFKWQDLTKSLRQSVLASKLDVSGYGKSIGSLMNIDNVINKLLATEGVEIGSIVGFDEKLRKNGKNTLLGNYKKNIIDWTKEIMEANPLMFLTAQPYVVNSYNQVSLDVYGDLLVNEKLTDDLEAGYYSYLMSGFKSLDMDSEEKNYYLNTFPKDYEAMLSQPAVKEAIASGKYKLLEELYLKPGEKGITYIAMSNRKKSAEVETEIVASWRDILDDDPELGEKLIKYAYLTSGFKTNINQFFSYIPTSWFIENNIDAHIAGTAKHMGSYKNVPEIYDEDFIDQFYRHNMDDNRLVPNINRKAVSGLVGTTGFSIIVPKGSKARRFVKMGFSRTVEASVVTTKYLYKLIGHDANDNAIYTKVSPLGITDEQGNMIYEYDFENNIPVSVIQANVNLAGINLDAYRVFNSKAEKPIHINNPTIPTGELNLKEKEDDNLNCELNGL